MVQQCKDHVAEGWQCVSPPTKPKDFTTRCSRRTARARPHVQLVQETIESLSDGQLLRYKHAAERLLLQLGITFNVYGDTAGTERIFPFDLIPRIIAGSGMGPHRARPEAAHPRAECLHRRHLSRPENPQGRRHSGRSDHVRPSPTGSSATGSNPPCGRLVPRHRHRPGARPRRRDTTCSRTICACPPASPTCWRIARC